MVRVSCYLFSTPSFESSITTPPRPPLLRGNGLGSSTVTCWSHSTPTSKTHNTVRHKGRHTDSYIPGLDYQTTLRTILSPFKYSRASIAFNQTITIWDNPKARACESSYPHCPNPGNPADLTSFSFFLLLPSGATLLFAPPFIPNHQRIPLVADTGTAALHLRDRSCTTYTQRTSIKTRTD